MELFRSLARSLLAVESVDQVRGASVFAADRFYSPSENVGAIAREKVYNAWRNDLVGDESRKREGREKERRATRDSHRACLKRVCADISVFFATVRDSRFSSRSRDTGKERSSRRAGNEISRAIRWKPLPSEAREFN